MKQDKRSYTFVFAPTSSFPLRKFNVYHKALYAIVGFAIIGLLTVAWGAYRLTQHGFVVAQNYNLKRHNRELKEENQKAKSEFDQLQSRLAVLDTNQRKLAEYSGVSRPDISKDIGRGGPSSETKLSDLEDKFAALESEQRYIKDVFDRNQIKLASTPNGWPVRGYITDGFGMRRNPFGGGGYESHAGLDIATNHGTAIEATADGRVIFAGMYGGYGNIVVIDHGYGITTRYGHMASISVRMGQHVTRGKTIGEVGSTGRSTAPHCHYEVRLHDRPVNPLSYISINK